MRAMFINEGRYWDSSSQYQAEYDEFWNELVPSQGEASTLQGEILRSMGRIMYDYYNNGFGNNRESEALFLNKHSNKFKSYIKDPNMWDSFFNMYEEICFGDYDKLWRKAEEEAEEEYSSHSRYSDDEDEESSLEDFIEDPNIDNFIKRNNWNVEGQMDDIMDGIIKYIRLTKNKLEPYKNEED